MSEDWQDSVNAQLGMLHGDVRNLLYGLIGSFILLIGFGATAYVQLGERIDNVAVAQAEINGKLDRVIQELDRKSEQ